MSSAALTPMSDIFAALSWDKTGVANFYQGLIFANSGTPTQFDTATNNGKLIVGLSIPGDIATVTGASLEAYAKEAGNKSGADVVTFQILKADLTTALTDAPTLSFSTTSFVDKSTTFAIQGGLTSQTDWNGAVLSIELATANSTLSIAWAVPTLTYTSSGGGAPVPPPLYLGGEGNAGGAAGLFGGGAAGGRRVQGIRYVWNRVCGLFLPEAVIRHLLPGAV